MCPFFSQLHQLPNKISQLSLSFLVCYDNRPPNNSNNQLPKNEKSFSEDDVIAASLHILHKDYFSVVTGHKLSQRELAWTFLEQAFETKKNL